MPEEKRHLPAVGDSEPDLDQLSGQFLDWVAARGLDLYPAQERALLEILTGSNVIVATPTGSGKSLIATAAHFIARGQGQRTWYTAPIKALVSEKFFALCRDFGPESVGMLTGDAAVNPGAPIMTCTAEVLAALVLREGRTADIGQVVMDEFHYYGDPQRGVAWQIPLLELPETQFILLSATLGDISSLQQDLERRTGRDTVYIGGSERPVPLNFEFSEFAVHEKINELLATDQAPIYIVHFTQLSAIERAQALTSVVKPSRSRRDEIAQKIGDFRFSAGFGTTLSRLLRQGIGVHHAGMLPKYRRLVEQLAQSGLLPLICGTDTLGVGINVPIRTVLLTGLVKFDGRRMRRLNAREFHQISGRAGRAGFDTEGLVVVEAPDHLIENQKLLFKAGSDPKKRRKIQRSKPPAGQISWSKETFDRIQTAEPEPLVSRFVVTHAMVLAVISRPGDTLEHFRRLLRENHEPGLRQVRLVRDAIQIYRSLLAAGVVEQLAEPDETGRRARLTVDLPPNFALNQPLSTFALAAMELLDLHSPSYALDLVSIIEATLADPRPVLLAQQSVARAAAVAEMKADGIEYEERLELIEEVTWPKPLAELLDEAFNMYAQGHPWVADYELSPKAVVRDAAEQAMGFSEFISHYRLARSEGVVLRYFADAYKALRNAVPERLQTDEVIDLIEWLGEVVRQTDSSLLEEWQQLTDPGISNSPVVSSLKSSALSDNPRALTVMIRNAMFRRVDAAALGRWDRLAELDPHWSAQRWADAFAEYFVEYDYLETGPAARSPALVQITPADGQWIIRQVLADPEGNHDFAISAEVDLVSSDQTGELQLRVTAVGPIG